MPTLEEAIAALNAPARSKAFAEQILLPMLQRIADTLAGSDIKTTCGILMSGTTPAHQLSNASKNSTWKCACNARPSHSPYPEAEIQLACQILAV